MIFFVDGQYVPEEEARVSVLDRGFLYGDSVYEAVRAIDGRIIFLEEHEERLKRSGALLGIDLETARFDLSLILNELLERNRVSDAQMRIIVSRGRGGRDQMTGLTPTWVVTIQPYEEISESGYDSGVSAVLVSVIRQATNSLNPRIKSSNLLNNILARREALQRGAAEGVMLNPDGFLAEGAHSNLFWLTEDGTLRTPALSVGLLAGVTRRKVLEVARAKGISVEEVAAGPSELDHAQEIFLTSTSWEVIAVTSWNGHAVGDGRRGEITKRLHEGLREMFGKGDAE